MVVSPAMAVAASAALAGPVAAVAATTLGLAATAAAASTSGIATLIHATEYVEAKGGKTRREEVNGTATKMSSEIKEVNGVSRQAYEIKEVNGMSRMTSDTKMVNGTKSKGTSEIKEVNGTMSKARTAKMCPEDEILVERVEDDDDTASSGEGSVVDSGSARP